MIEIGTEVFITENTRVLLGLPEGLVYEVKDTLNLDVDKPVVLSCDEMGSDWVEFFSEDELITIT